MPTNSASCCLGNAFRNPATCPCSSPTIATRTAALSCGPANAAEQHNIKRPATVRRERRNAWDASFLVQRGPMLTQPGLNTTPLLAAQITANLPLRLLTGLRSWPRVKNYESRPSVLCPYFPQLKSFFAHATFRCFLKMGTRKTVKKLGKEEAAFAVSNQESQRTRRDF